MKLLQSHINLEHSIFLGDPEMKLNENNTHGFEAMHKYLIVAEKFK
jgi:hypothetical protein